MLAITGVTGKSGAVFAQELCNDAARIRTMFPDGIRLILHSDKETIFDKENHNLTVEKTVGDLTDEAFLKEALKGVDTLVHIAGIHWSGEVIRAAAVNKVRRVIFVHTTGIYSKYKEAGEEYRHIDEYVYKTCLQENIKLSILRPTMIYGSPADKNVITFIKMVDKLPIMPTVNGARYELQPVHFADLGRAYFDILVNEDITGGRDYILSGKEPIMLRDMFKIIGENLGKKVKFVSCPYVVAYFGAVVIYAISLKRFDFREKVQRLCEPRVYSHEDAARDFGYAPRAFAEGVKDEIELYKRSKVGGNAKQQ